MFTQIIIVQFTLFLIYFPPQNVAYIDVVAKFCRPTVGFSVHVMCLRIEPVIDRLPVDWRLYVFDYEQVTVGQQVVNAIRRTRGEQFTVGPASRTMCKLVFYTFNLETAHVACTSL